MTEMKRVTISLPDELDKRILSLKKSDKFIRSSYAEIARYLLEIGLNSKTQETKEPEKVS